MKDKKKIILLVATIILVIAAILCFTVFNKGGNNTIIDKTNVDSLHNMVPMVQRANSGMYSYGYTDVNGKSIEEIVVGALNHYEYVNCSNEENKNSCDTIEVEKIISEVKEIYGLDISKDDIEKAEVNKDDKGLQFYVYADGISYQEYVYKNGIFTVAGEKGFVHKNNVIVKKERKDNSYLIYEKIYYLGLDFKENEMYEVLYDSNMYSKEIAREKITVEDAVKKGGLDLSKYSDYGVTYIHTFKKNASGNYQYFSSTVEGFKVEDTVNIPPEVQNESK